MFALQNERLDVLLVDAGVRIGVHGAEFQAPEGLAELTDACLLKQDRAGRGEFDRHADANQHRGEQHQQAETSQHVNYSLQKRRQLMTLEIGVEYVIPCRFR
jgi:hypothetical protein